MSEKRQLCTMRVADHLLGLEVVAIQEVIGYQPTTAVPLSPREVVGLINLRGQILTAIDLRRRLGFEERPADALPMNVVVQTTLGGVSLLVDSIGEVVEVDSEMSEEAPSTVDDDVRELVRTVYKFEDALLLELDIERAAELPQPVAV